ncbi:MAG: type II toxin-antitoxin system RelE/ParE family toxin [Rhizomicrobium sp.]
MSETIFSPEAQADLELIGDYIARDNPSRATSFVKELRARAASIAEMPKAHPKRDDLGRGIRMAVHRRYLIFFRERPGHVEISRILHSARDVSAIFNPEPQSQRALAPAGTIRGLAA